jgi:hypothetical protein
MAKTYLHKGHVIRPVMHGWLAVFSGNIPYMTSKHKTVKRAKDYIDVVLDSSPVQL